MPDETTLPHLAPQPAPAPATEIRKPDAPSMLAAKPAASADNSAKTKLRGFEDANFGKDATRINGTVERGIGSRFKAMSPEKHAEYAALEALVAAEQAISDSTAALDKAKQDHDAALARLAVAQKAAEAAAAVH